VRPLFALFLPACGTVPWPKNDLGDQRTLRGALSRFLFGDDPCRLARASVAHGFWKPELWRRHAELLAPILDGRGGRSANACCAPSCRHVSYTVLSPSDAREHQRQRFLPSERASDLMDEVRLQISKIGACPLRALLTTTAREPRSRVW
jgi:hypothetical protein